MKKDKKELICETVAAILAAGQTDITSLTVSEIARAAGIGKGTVYDYFGSKEEILLESARFGIERMVRELLERMQGVASLETRLEIVLEDIERRHLIVKSLTLELMQALEGASVPELCAALDIENSVEPIKELMNALASTACPGTPSEEEYDAVRYAITSGVAGFVIWCRIGKWLLPLDPPKARAYAMRQILSAIRDAKAPFSAQPTGGS